MHPIEANYSRQADGRAQGVSRATDRRIKDRLVKDGL
jgi:hypothetical protein